MSRQSMILKTTFFFNLFIHLYIYLLFIYFFFFFFSKSKQMPGVLVYHFARPSPALPWCNPLWLTGLKAPTNQLTNWQVTDLLFLCTCSWVLVSLKIGVSAPLRIFQHPALCLQRWLQPGTRRQEVYPWVFRSFGDLLTALKAPIHYQTLSYDSVWSDQLAQALIHCHPQSYDPICCQGNSYKIGCFIGPLRWFPTATDRTVGLSLTVANEHQRKCSNKMSTRVFRQIPIRVFRQDVETDVQTKCQRERSDTPVTVLIVQSASWCSRHSVF